MISAVSIVIESRRGDLNPRAPSVNFTEVSYGLGKN
jgi:hypothetical protein